MPLTLREQADLTQFSDFQAKVRMAMIGAATAIFPEVAKPLRNALALNVLNNSALYIERFVLAVAVNVAPNLAAITSAAVTDTVIINAVSAVWNDIAGETT